MIHRGCRVPEKQIEHGDGAHGFRDHNSAGDDDRVVASLYADGVHMPVRKERFLLPGDGGCCLLYLL